MALHIGFAYNEKPQEEDEPPSGVPPRPGSHDRYAEWDDPATIAAVERALQRAGHVTRLEADPEFPLKLSRTRPDIVFNIAERSEEHTSELQSRENLVCRLLLENKNTKHNNTYNN